MLKQYNDLQARFESLEKLYQQKGRKKYNERGAGRKKKTDDERTFDLWSQGKIVKEIAEVLKIGMATVKRALARSRAKV